jgi:hypothetical protein
VKNYLLYSAVDCAEGKSIFIFYNDEIVRYIPKEAGKWGKYVPPAKGIQAIRALDDGQHKVHVQTYTLVDLINLIIKFLMGVNQFF